ncbi:ABC transporter substrate-binding protein [Gilvimarinus sp. 1_MG-2023]|uniref:ABC transporter substrate-binding protein n=1 Tax=Gilvimarinus sp. 1_MG-2023 TaxID=3062638 RepID=UPI0026E1E6B4|nr:ABC transporter substrate-binding protein [Gilvimarinus sp. 1_MG-2023]MDO6746456.1 ABC transporter substrate-binding protein [Gilvimarinus sp. 1_MG-2023]
MYKFNLTSIFKRLLPALWLLANTCTAADWSEVQAEARGDTVYFYAWGGSDDVNRYLRWVDGELNRRYGVRLKHVKVPDIAQAVQRLQVDAQAGRLDGGAIDLLWVNGENFHVLKRDNLLLPDVLTDVPNSADLLHDKLPLASDFGVPVDGLEVPWGIGQFNLIARDNSFADAAINAAQLLDFAKQNPGKLSYPKPPDFIGTTLLKSLLLDLTDSDPRLYQPASEAAMAQLLPVLWQYLDKLHPMLWEEGTVFAQSSAQQLQWLADAKLSVAFSFNPQELAAKVEASRLPTNVQQHYFSVGAITNSHYLAIPRNASHSAAAKVAINFLISEKAQQRKADTAYWGDPAVVDLPEGGTLLPSATELHASWQNALEQRWLQRYQR